MNARLLAATLAAVAAVAGSALPADAKPAGETYSVQLPVPFPVMEGMAHFHGCWNGEEGVSKHTKAIKLPSVGLFKAQVSYTGDWDLYLFDTKGTILAAAETVETGNVNPAVEKISWKKAKKGQTVNLVVCNWSGLKDATVSWTLTK